MKAEKEIKKAVIILATALVITMFIKSTLLDDITPINQRFKDVCDKMNGTIDDNEFCVIGDETTTTNTFVIDCGQNAKFSIYSNSTIELDLGLNSLRCMTAEVTKK